MYADIVLTVAVLIGAGAVCYVAGYIGGREASITADEPRPRGRLLGDTINGDGLDRGAMHYIEQSGGLDRGVGRCPCCCHCKDDQSNYEPKWSPGSADSTSNESSLTYEVRDLNG